MPKVEPVAESQKQRQRHPSIEDNEPNSRGPRRRLSLTDGPIRIRSGSGAQLGQIQLRPNQHISHALQQLGDAAKADASVQILLGVIADYKNKFPTVARRENEEFQTCEDFADEDDRWWRQRKWYDFRKQVWEGVHNHMAEGRRSYGQVFVRML